MNNDIIKNATNTLETQNRNLSQRPLVEGGSSEYFSLMESKCKCYYALKKKTQKSMGSRFIYQVTSRSNLKKNA